MSRLQRFGETLCRKRGDSAAGTGCRALQNLSINKIFVENFGHAECAGEEAILSLWQYQKLQEEAVRTSISQVQMHVEESTVNDRDLYGAACVASVSKAVSSLRLPFNIRTIIPLCGHVIDAAAIEPGDIFKSMAEDTIEMHVILENFLK